MYTSVQSTTFLLLCSMLTLLFRVKTLSFSLCALILLGVPIQANTTHTTPTLELKEAISSANIDSHIGYFADNQGNQTLDDMLIHPNFFVPITEKRFTFNVHTHWYQVYISNPNDQSKEWYMTTGISSAPFLKAYWISQDGNIKVISNSTKPTPVEKKKVRFSGYIIPMELEAHEQGTLLIEYQSMANFPLMLKPYTERALITRSLTLMLLNGIFCGVIAVFFFFFLIQFLMRPTRTLGYYTLFIFSLIAFTAQLNGYGVQLIWADLKNYNSLFSSIAGGSIYVWYFLFTAKIFQLQEQNKKLYYIMIGLSSAVVAIVIIGVFFPTDYLLSMFIVFGLPWPSITALWAVRQKHPSAKFFLIGSCIHCATTYLLMLACLGIHIGDNQYLFGIACAGQLADIICFSVAIFVQQNRIREQYHHQVELRMSDMHSLTESEQITAKMLSLSKQTVLQTATTVHDLIQPLASIGLTLSTQDETAQSTKNMNSALDYANTLLSSILKRSKMDFHKTQESVRIRTLMNDILTRHQAVFKGKNIELKMYCPDVGIACLPLVINRIVDNLLTNALRYTDTGKVLLCGRLKGNNQFLIQVWDTGQGIPKAKVKKILSPFKQLNNEDIENMGFGLGLFIVKSLCDEAGYTLDIRSNESRGSCFSVLIKQTNTQF